MAEILSFDDSEKTNGSEKIKDQNLLKSLWEKFSNLETSIKLGIISITLLIIAIPLALQVDPNLIQNAFTPVPTIQPSIVPISKSPDKPQITINSLTPLSGPIGTMITILGSGFSGTYKININLVQGVAEVKPINSNTLLFKFPGAICQIGKMCAAVLPPPGRYYISITNSLGQTSNSLPFILTQNVAPTATPTPTTTPSTTSETESFESDFGGWAANHYIDCETRYSPPCLFQWNIRRSGSYSYDGTISLAGYLNGINDDGTIWMEKAFAVPANSVINADISFYLWSQQSSNLNQWPVVAYVGLQRPVKETDFSVIGSTNDLAGWKKYTYSLKNISTGSNNNIWMAFGFGASWESARTYYMDFVKVNIINQ